MTSNQTTLNYGGAGSVSTNTTTINNTVISTGGNEVSASSDAAYGSSATNDAN